MTPDKNDRLAGLLYGSFIADSLALGAHWIYDQHELEKKFGRVTDFLQPLGDSYHPKKLAGEQTHYGDQALVLMESLMAVGHYDEADFSERWRKSWTGYADYLDHATKDTLKNLENGAAPEDAGSDSEELGGAARLAPLLVALHDQPGDEQSLAAIAQSELTHASPIARDAAQFLTQLVLPILHGHPIGEAIEVASEFGYNTLSVERLMHKVVATSALSTNGAAKELGLACPAEQALPTLLLLLTRHADDFESAIIDNVMAGGDNAARGLALGMILGAHHGKSAIPPRWIAGLKAAPQIDAFLARFPDQIGA